MIISKGDILHLITPYNEGRVPRQRDSLYSVDQEGEVDFGVGLSKFRAGGKTTEELRKEVALKHGSAALKEIKIAICSSSEDLRKNQKIAIFGQVKDAKITRVKIPTTLGHALKKAGGANPFAAINRIQILRNGKTLFVNTKKEGTEQKLIPGDLVFVPIKKYVGR